MKLCFFIWLILEARVEIRKRFLFLSFVRKWEQEILRLKYPDLWKHLWNMVNTLFKEIYNSIWQNLVPNFSNLASTAFTIASGCCHCIQGAITEDNIYRNSYCWIIKATYTEYWMSSRIPAPPFLAGSNSFIYTFFDW